MRLMIFLFSSEYLLTIQKCIMHKKCTEECDPPVNSELFFSKCSSTIHEAQSDTVSCELLFTIMVCRPNSHTVSRHDLINEYLKRPYSTRHDTWHICTTSINDIHELIIFNVALLWAYKGQKLMFVLATKFNLQCWKLILVQSAVLNKQLGCTILIFIADTIWRTRWWGQCCSQRKC